MAMYRTCPRCGASLDPGEKCDCTKKELPDANQNSSKTSGLSTATIIAQAKAKVKPNLLRELREDKGIPPKELVKDIKALYPRFDRPLLTKAEHGDEYGVDLRRDAVEMLAGKYGIPLDRAIPEKREDSHRLRCKIACRLEDDDYNDLLQFIHEDGFEQMQAWLTFRVRKYLNQKRKAAIKHGRV